MTHADNVSPFPRYSFGNVIRSYREKAGYNQGTLAGLLHVNKNTVYNWENNKCKPDADAIGKLCLILRIPIQELFNIQDAPEKLTYSETSLLSNYRAMSAKTQRLALNAIIGMAEEDARLQEQELKNGYYVMGMQNTKAAAGIGCQFSDEIEIAHCFVKVSKLSSRADTLVTVSGRSMEPIYHNGDVLFVEYAEAGDVGDDLICSSADGVVVKRMGADRALYSVNTELPYSQKYEDDCVRIMGKVIGIADGDEIAPDKLVPLLEEVLSDEVAAFEKENNQ